MDLRRTLDRHPSIKAGVKVLLGPFRRQTSDDYKPLPEGARASVFEALKGAWQDEGIPLKQRAGIEKTLAAYRAGVGLRAFDVLVDMLRPLAADTPGASLLEVGCSSGYYADVLAARQLDLCYAGCDFSQAFVALAKQCHPELRFDVEDATALRYADDSFDIVLSGCCLLHIPDYRRAIAETARVARRYAIFHRTPVLARHATRFFTKRAYGVQTVEIHFSESELVSLFASHGLRVIGIDSIATDWRDGDAFAVKTYLCEKALQ
jgi:SAM-dependent methyltransferase